MESSRACRWQHAEAGVALVQARVEKLREAAEQLGLAQHVDFCLGVSNQELRSLLGDAVGGLHTMLDEHFGISVVEYMAAGTPSALNPRSP